MNKSKSPATQSPLHEVSEYKVASVAPPHDAVRLHHPDAHKGRTADVEGNSAGGEDASAVGCNANNGNGSVRTLNGNNALSNGNDNFAGAFAITNGTPFGETSTARSARPNNVDIPAATGGQGQCDYGSPLPPFCEDGESAESNATATTTGRGIFKELREANAKRKLKNLKRFFTNKEIVQAGVDRALHNAKKTKEVRWALRHKAAIVERIIREMETETYHVGAIEHRVIPPHSKDGKPREADIYSVYDRCVMNVMLIIVRDKMERLLTRHVYSGVPTRSMFSNTRKYCMVNKVRQYVKTHPDDYVMLTDIRHFYQNLSSRVVLGVLFKTIVCPFTRRLFAEVLLALPYIAIGGTLSQLVAMVTLAEMDMEMLTRFHPRFYAAFGDNRLFGGDKVTVIAMKSYEASFLAGRYGLPLKGDYSLHRVRDGFRFCRYDFFRDTVTIRAELRRSAIRAAKRGQKHYAGYKGILDKTDSHNLQYLIEHRMEQLRTKDGHAIRPMQGERVRSDTLVGERIILTDYRVIPNGKESEYYLRIQAVHVKEYDGRKEKRLVAFNNGSFEVKDFFKALERGEYTLPFDTRLQRDGQSYYFTGYHTSNKEACEAIIENLGIEI